MGTEQWEVVRRVGFSGEASAYEVFQSGVSREQASRISRELNAKTSMVAGRSLWWARRIDSLPKKK